MARKFSKGGIVSAVIMGLLTLILLPILIVNIVLIVKGSGGGVVPPDIFGVAPLAVTTGSMDGDRDDSFAEGALIFIDVLSDEEKRSLKQDDIITYYIEGSEGISYITHRIISINYSSDGTTPLTFVTRGDANNSNDPNPVSVDNVVGRCVYSIGGVGAFAMFLQTPVGILVFVGIPVVAFIAYDAIRITLYNRKVKQQAQTDKALADKDEEIARLRALVDQQQADPAPSAGQSAPPEVIEIEAEVEAAPTEPAYEDPVSDDKAE